MLHALLVVTAAIALQTKPADPHAARTDAPRTDGARAGEVRTSEIVVGEPDLIEASPLGPKDNVFEAPQKRRAFRNLIQMRTSFAHELLDSVAQVGGK